MPAVFISHATKDDAEVTRIHDALEKLTGVEMWVDHKDIRAGENWDKTIEKAVGDCPYLLLIISRASMSSVPGESERGPRKSGLFWYKPR